MEDDLNIDVIESPDSGRPIVPGFNKRKIILLAAILLVVFLVVVAALSTVLALSLTLTGGDDESESNNNNNNNPPGPKPTGKPSAPIDLDEWYSNDGIVLGQAPPPFPDVKKEALRNTSEYQITLDMKAVGNNRTVIISKILSILSNFTGLPFDANNGAEAVRNQHVVNDVKSSCVDGPQIRVRDYVTGPKTGGTTVDIKGNSGSNKQGSVDFPYYPGPAFPDSPYSEPEGNPAPSSFQKVEKDVHPCDFKYSRETRIFFEYPPAIETCHDLLHMFPWAFPNLPANKQDNKLSTGTIEHWWVLEHSAYLYSSEGKAQGTQHPGVISTGEGEEDTTKGHTGTRCESTVTLKYSSVSDAVSGKNPSYGEWSLRIYSTDDGLGDWDSVVVAAVSNMYQQMLTQVGDPDFPC